MQTGTGIWTYRRPHGSQMRRTPPAVNLFRKESCHIFVRQERLGLRVDRGELELFRISDKQRQKPPKHHVQRAGAFAVIPNDDWLHCLRRDVVIRSEFKGKSVQIAECKRLYNALFVGSALVAATHLFVGCSLLRCPSLLLGRADPCSCCGTQGASAFALSTNSLGAGTSEKKLAYLHESRNLGVDSCYQFRCWHRLHSL